MGSSLWRRAHRRKQASKQFVRHGTWMTINITKSWQRSNEKRKKNWGTEKVKEQMQQDGGTEKLDTTKYIRAWTPNNIIIIMAASSSHRQRLPHEFYTTLVNGHELLGGSISANWASYWERPYALGERLLSKWFRGQAESNCARLDDDRQHTTPTWQGGE